MFKETTERLKSNSPKYFKKLRNIALQVGSGLLAIITLNSTLNLELDPIFIKIISYLLVTAAAVAGTSQLTKDDGQK